MIPSLFSPCENEGDKQLVTAVKIAPVVGSFRYICAS
jgi:hypothetical protein